MIVSCVLMKIERAFVAVCGVGVLLSTTWAVKLNGPAAVGVPVMAPVAAFSDRPVGSKPAEMENVYGVVPLMAAKDCEYGEFATPLDKDVVVIVSAGLIQIERA